MIKLGGGWRKLALRVVLNGFMGVEVIKLTFDSHVRQVFSRNQKVGNKGFIMELING